MREGALGDGVRTGRLRRPERETMAVRLRDEIRELGEEMERRMRSKVKAVEQGEMPHWRQEPLVRLFERMKLNLVELKDVAAENPCDPRTEAATQKAADVANLANLIRLRIAKGDRAE